MNPASIPYDWYAWRDAYRPSAQRWAARQIVNRDGSVRLVPLYMRDVPMWAAEVFDGFPEFRIDVSMEPDA